MSHFIMKCRECDKIMAQCRCVNCNKEVRYGTCMTCMDKKIFPRIQHSTEEIVEEAKKKGGYSAQVMEFAKACGHVGKKPNIMEEKEVDFLIQMINDECEELIQAYTIYEQMDALIDLIYYIVDAAIKKGVDLDPLFAIVHNANMRKVVNGKVFRRYDGKILKPKDWYPPDEEFCAEIDRQIGGGA